MHSHITRAVAAIHSCFVLVRTHQHGIARRKGLTEDHRSRHLLPRRVQKHSFKRQLHSVNVVAVAAAVQDSALASAVNGRVDNLL